MSCNDLRDQGLRAVPHNLNWTALHLEHRLRTDLDRTSRPRWCRARSCALVEPLRGFRLTSDHADRNNPGWYARWAEDAVRGAGEHVKAAKPTTPTMFPHYDTTRPWFAIGWFLIWSVFQTIAVVSVINGTWEQPAAFPAGPEYESLIWPEVFFVPLYVAAAILLWRRHWLAVVY